MSERYTKVFSLPPDLYAQGSPLVISAGNLLKDNLTGKVLVQLKIRNISPKTVKTGKVLVHAMDTLGKPLDGDTTHEYLDLSADQGDEFGQKTAIPLPNPSTRGFTVEVRQVGFADNSVWEGTNSLWEPLPAPESLNDALHGDPELVKQFRLCFGDPCEAMPRRYKDVWRCACSAWNTADVCYYCGKGKDDLLALDLEKLIAEKDARLAREKAEREAKVTAEKAAAEANARKTKKILTILIPFVVVCVAAVLAITRSGWYFSKRSP